MEEISGSRYTRLLILQKKNFKSHKKFMDYSLGFGECDTKYSNKLRWYPVHNSGKLLFKSNCLSNWQSFPLLLG